MKRFTKGPYYSSQSTQCAAYAAVFLFCAGVCIPYWSVVSFWPTLMFLGIAVALIFAVIGSTTVYFQITEDALEWGNRFGHKTIRLDQVESWLAYDLPTVPRFNLTMTDGKSQTFNPAYYDQPASLAKSLRDALNPLKYSRPSEGCLDPTYFNDTGKAGFIVASAITAIPLVTWLVTQDPRFGQMAAASGSIAVLLGVLGALMGNIPPRYFKLNGTVLTQVFGNKSADFDLTKVNGESFLYPSLQSRGSGYTSLILEFPNGKVGISGWDVNLWDILVAASEHLKYLPKDQVAAVKEFNDWLSCATDSSQSGQKT